jgi:hypothetical protein
MAGAWFLSPSHFNDESGPNGHQPTGLQILGGITFGIDEPSGAPEGSLLLR